MSSVELSQKQVATRSELGQLKAQIAEFRNMKQLLDLSKAQIEKESAGKPVWKGVGKAFLQVPCEEYTSQEITKRETELDDWLKDLSIKERYLDTTLRNLTKALDALKAQ